MMNIDMIMQKGLAGESLNTKEMELLMLHAIDLLKFIEVETQASIGRAHLILESKYEIAA